MKKLKKLKKMSEKTVQLHVLTRGPTDYTDSVRILKKNELPPWSRRVTGTKCEYAILSFQPNYPEWYNPQTCKGFNAIGYHQYYSDTRISTAFNNVGEADKIKWESLKKWLIIGGAAVVFVFVLMRFL